MDKVIEASEGADNANTAIPSNLFCQCVNALDMPKCVYNSTTKSFEDRRYNKTIFGGSDDKAYMWRHRYENTRQKVLRHPFWDNSGSDMEVE